MRERRGRERKREASECVVFARSSLYLSARAARSDLNAVSRIRRSEAKSESIRAIAGRQYSRCDSPFRFLLPLFSGARHAAENSCATRTATAAGARLTASNRERSASARRTGLGSVEISCRSRSTSDPMRETCPVNASALTGHEDTVTTLFGSLSSLAAANASSIARCCDRGSVWYSAARL